MCFADKKDGKLFNWILSNNNKIKLINWTEVAAGDERLEKDYTKYGIFLQLVYFINFIADRSDRCLTRGSIEVIRSMSIYQDCQVRPFLSTGRQFSWLANRTLTYILSGELAPTSDGSVDSIFLTALPHCTNKMQFGIKPTKNVKTSKGIELVTSASSQRCTVHHCDLG